MAKKDPPPTEAEAVDEALPRCGLVMPISATDGCPETHWAEVRQILEEAISQAGFDPLLVSDADEIGVIQKRIIQNLYQNPIVVCDVSGRNANVMFELGVRIAFDKPVIVVKDDKTPYSFDTAPIEHVPYPRDLRFQKIVDFKEELSSKIKATSMRSASDPEYTTFLRHFGEFKVAEIESKVVSSDVVILDEIRALRDDMSRVKVRLDTLHPSQVPSDSLPSPVMLRVTGPEEQLTQLKDMLPKYFPAEVRNRYGGLVVEADSARRISLIARWISERFPSVRAIRVKTLSTV